jgi:hypothetical protein
MNFFEQYERTNLVCHRTRDSLSVHAYNKLQRKLKSPKELPFSFDYAFRKYKCTLGCTQKSRGQGKRPKKTQRFRGCGAYFRAVVSNVGTVRQPRWVIRVGTEVRSFDSNMWVMRNSNTL